MKNLESDWEGLLFDIRRSVRYHNRRRAFYDRLDQLTNVIALVFGSATIYSVLTPQARNTWTVLSAASVTIFSAINLVVGSSQRARSHYDLAKRFFALEEEIIQVEKPTGKLLREMTTKRLSIEKDEPPVLRVLDCICYNEQVQAMAYGREQMIKIGWWQRLCSPFFDVRPDKMRRLSDLDTAK
ncbi:hypothetical protein EKN56_06430 [Limnobaculum zhutongyuii]|uniref:SMODS and SLOG-associating 2TM effector domain-containing protein n=1 Tax=Limnobaculum zhutongyuii TaxID=2498113 RepID=A0A411WR91_9GAMM|nr:hypothetical protein EKN56_06430 [Limnobaculum zhutongyuii]TQS86156.1 hypothetical protein ELQ32_20265 [Limnobaculum zhutongyuii]